MSAHIGDLLFWIGLLLSIWTMIIYAAFVLPFPLNIFLILAALGLTLQVWGER